MTIISPTPAIPDVLIDDADLREILLALKTIAEIREGRHIDTGLRFITYYELVDYLRGNDQLVVEAATIGHNHDTLYSALDHLHDARYSLLTHDHNALYSLLTHAHDEQYALLIHGHDYAALGHKHDGLYSLLAHNHALANLSEKSYNSLTDKPTIPVDHSDLNDDETGKHRIINDLGTSATELWSSTKISDAISGANPAHDHDALYAFKIHPHGEYALLDHNHDLLYALLGHNHNAVYSLLSHHHDGDYSALDHDHDSDYSDINHNHNLADLTEKAYASLTGKPTIPSAHSDLTDDEQAKHRLIVDSGEAADELWSSNKIASEITSAGPHDHDILYAKILHAHGEYSLLEHNHDALYSLLGHNHNAVYSLLTHNHNLNDLDEKSYNSLTDKPTIPANHSDLNDDEATKHRLINDAGDSQTELLSSSKIKADFALGTHNHDLADLSEKSYTSLTDQLTGEQIKTLYEGEDETNAFTDTEKTKLTGIADNANNYSHPGTHSLDIITETGTKKILTDTERTKLTGIEENANDYSHPAAHSIAFITQLQDELDDKSALDHNHALNGLTEKSYDSLTDKPTIPADHSDLNDNEATKHRLINDAATSETELWSSDKIDTAIAAAGGGAHEHDIEYAKILHGHDYSPVKHKHPEYVFEQFLAGFKDNGLHDVYSGDLNDIDANSLYNFSPVVTANHPPFLSVPLNEYGFVWTHLYHATKTLRVQFCWPMQRGSGFHLGYRITGSGSTGWYAWQEVYTEDHPPPLTSEGFFMATI